MSVVYKDGISPTMLKEARKLFNEFQTFQDIDHKCLAFIYMRTLKELFPHCSELSNYYQIMCRYMNNHSVDLDYISFLRKKRFDDYVNSNYLFFEKNIPYSALPQNDYYSFTNIQNYDYLNILYSFLWSTSHNLYYFFRKIEHDGKILLRAPNSYEKIFGLEYGDQNGTAISNSAKREKSYVYVNSMENIADLACLVHEVGHAYFFNLVNFDSSKKNNPEESIKVEIPSRLLEYMFILYLEKIGFYEALDLKQRFFDFIYYNRVFPELFSRYKYSLGNFVAIFYADKINREYSLEYFLRAIHYTNVRDITLGTKMQYDYYLEEQQKSLYNKKNQF